MKMPARKPWSDRLERVLIRLVVVAALIVMIAQALLTGDPVKEATTPVTAPDRPQFSLKDYAGILQSPVVTLQLKNYSSLPLAKVLVNGKSRGEFRDRYVTVFVREGDVLEVDGTRYNRPLDIEVLDVSKEVILPATGTRVRVEGNISALGQVSLSDR